MLCHMLARRKSNASGYPTPKQHAIYPNARLFGFFLNFNGSGFDRTNSSSASSAHYADVLTFLFVEGYACEFAADRTEVGFGVDSDMDRLSESPATISTSLSLMTFIGLESSSGTSML